MYERALSAFANWPAWKRIVVAWLTTILVLWFVATMILVLFAFAATLGVIVAAIACFFVLFGVGRFVTSSHHYR